MRKTNNPDDLHRIYASKYSNWIVPYLNCNNISIIPSLLCCNTLYQIPEFFVISNKEFFVLDYYLYSFFYDLNYAYSKPQNNEYAINLFIKTYIEQAFLKERFDLCFDLCKTYPEIEQYKKSADYRNKQYSTILVEKTNIQEAFLFLHEATHFLLRKNGGVKNSICYKTIKGIYASNKIKFKDDFFEESICDYASINYILKNTFGSDVVYYDYFSAIFQTIIYIYALQIIRTCQLVPKESFKIITDKNAQSIFFRLNGVYGAIYEYLLKNDHNELFHMLENSYHDMIQYLISLSSDIREICFYIEQDAVNNLYIINGVDDNIKKQIIIDYLNIIE